MNNALTDITAPTMATMLQPNMIFIFSTYNSVKRAVRPVALSLYTLRYSALLIAFTVLLAGISSAAQDAAAPARPPIIGVAHIGLKTDDMSAARQFYTGLLGFQEPFSLNKADGSLMLTYFKVNDHQYIEVFPELKVPKEDRLIDVAFETTDAEQLRAYLASKGAKVPDKLGPRQDGNLGFDVVDPDGHDVEFIQYVPGSLHEKQFGKYLPENRISQHMIHVGITVKDRDAADHFYRDILGFKQTWYGGMTDTRTDWVDMRVPEGTDWLEYMLNVHDPDPRVLGIMHHLALGTPSVDASYKILLKRGLKTTEAPKIGRDGKWQLNLYDPNLTRVEMMEPAPVQKPCCSAINKD
jgi:catechol 2,3-dioxygenase-like lactoylglutathione lyase family enzyme